MQRTFSETIRFTPDGWYAHEPDGAKKAMQARNQFAKEQKAKGYKVSKFSLPNQLLTFGGINTNHPEIEIVTTCYGVNWR